MRDETKVVRRVWLGVRPDQVDRLVPRFEAVALDLAAIVADGADPMLRAQAAIARAHLEDVCALLDGGRR
jgi:hypothetical protein